MDSMGVRSRLEEPRPLVLVLVLTLVLAAEGHHCQAVVVQGQEVPGKLGLDS